MILDELATKLTADGLVTSGFVISKSILPATPDKVIAIYETGGTGPEKFLGNTPSQDMPTVQVVVRGVMDDYVAPRMQAERLYQAMLNYGAFTVSGVRYAGFNMLQAPFPMEGASGRDENKRIRITFNALIMKDQSPTS